MTIQTLDIAEPFFGIGHLENETKVPVEGKAIVLNLSETPLKIRDQKLGYLQSVIVVDEVLQEVSRAIVLDRFAGHASDEALFEEVRKHWPLAFDVRGEERLRGVEHYMSPKTRVGSIGFSLYHSASVPLNVGLHRDHPFCPVPGFKEVHTQIVGYGKMQQYRERDVATLYLEEPMAPGTTHKPMFDAEGNYPWHQYETITPGIFMAVEILPEGAQL